MIVNNINNRLSYSLYNKKENKQVPSFGFKLGLNHTFNPERVKKGLIHESVNLGIAAALAHTIDLPLFQTFTIVKIAKDISTATINYIKAPLNFKLQKMIIKHDYPSNMLRPVMAVIDCFGDKIIGKLKKPN